jgi:cell division protein ZapE
MRFARWLLRPAPSRSEPVTSALRTLLDRGELRPSTSQMHLASRLDDLARELGVDGAASQTTQQQQPRRLLSWLGIRRSPPRPRGLYIHGGVGVGKSMLMDMFHSAATASGVGSLRVHFHDFLLGFHADLFHHAQASRGSHAGAVDVIAARVASKYRVVCFDEFQVWDAADALILRTLFGRLFEEGVSLVATSNRVRWVFFFFFFFFFFCPTLTNSLEHRLTAAAAEPVRERNQSRVISPVY